MQKEENKKTKLPTPKKRDIRNNKQRLINKIFKSKVRTTMQSFEKALQEGNKSKIQISLNLVYSMMDRGVKRGIFKKNKAARLKSHAIRKSSLLSN
ncbi:MAG: 30S ribosomal protein S20 [Chlamydiales bacterium]